MSAVNQSLHNSNSFFMLKRKEGVILISVETQEELRYL